MNLRKNKGRMRVPKTSAPRMGVTEEFYFGGFCETRVTIFFTDFVKNQLRQKLTTQDHLRRI